MNKPFNKIDAQQNLLARMITGTALVAPLVATGLLVSASTQAAGLINLTATNVTGAFAVGAAPAGFNPLKASDAELAAYGVPPRPDATKTPQAYASWQRAVTANGQRIVPELKVTDIQHGPSKSVMRQGAQAGVTNNSTSSNWSGYTNRNSLTSYNSSSSFYYIIADYVVPNVTNATCDGSWDYSSEWVGIDGWGSPDVLQAGTSADAYCSGSTTSTYYNAWYEWYPNYETAISNFPIAPGDNVFVEVWDVSSTQGYAYLHNFQTNQTVEIAMTAPSGTHLIGNSAEWVVERPGVGGSLATLADYHFDYFSGAAAYTLSYAGVTPSSSTSFAVNMLSNSGATISIPSLLGSQGIEFEYDKNGSLGY